MFDVQVKRIHEYKRQLLNLLYVVVRYLRILDNPAADDRAARRDHSPARRRPAITWRRRSSSSSTTSRASSTTIARVGDKLKLCFLPDYDVSLAQEIMPAADLSEQISTAGMEASGTGNMKLSLNGALTIGTLDGANIEIRDAVGEENIFIFGMTTEEVVARRAQGYSPAAGASRSNPELKRAIDLIDSGHFTPRQHLRLEGRHRPAAERRRTFPGAGGFRRLRSRAGSASTRCSRNPTSGRASR